jgi:cystathionine beta-lyase/cystathionine gamma-synthase
VGLLRPPPPPRAFPTPGHPHPPTAGVIDAFMRLEPAAVVLDSMCNSRGLCVPDWVTLMDSLARAATKDVRVVVDNTCASALFQPLTLAPPNPHLRLLMFESLTKYAQFGFDRTAAGMIVAHEGDAAALDGWREHLGTNIADQCVWVIPEPNRGMLCRRLRRIERNASLLAHHIAEVCERVPGPVTGVCYPGLATHPCHAGAARLGFSGGLLALELAPEWDGPRGQGRVVRNLIAEARRAGASLVAGAGFGFNVTRIYRTATDAGLDPFLRISAGTEDLLEVERLKSVFARTVKRLCEMRPPRPR